MSVDTRRTFSLGTDPAGRLLGLVEDRGGYILRRQAGSGAPLAEIRLSASQIRDMAFLTDKR